MHDLRFKRVFSSRTLGRVWAIAVIIGATSCSNIVGCSPSASPGIVVHIKDAGTGAGIASGAVLYWSSTRAPTSVDSVRTPTDTAGLAITQGAGVYSLTVKKAGYADWIRNGVVASTTGGQCQYVQSVMLDALLLITATQ